jgi:hypothetical protein
VILALVATVFFGAKIASGLRERAYPK